MIHSLVISPEALSIFGHVFFRLTAYVQRNLTALLGRNGYVFPAIFINKIGRGKRTIE